MHARVVHRECTLGDGPRQFQDGGFFWVGDGGVWGMGGERKELGLIRICKSVFFEEIEIPGRKKKLTSMTVRDPVPG